MDDLIIQGYNLQTVIPTCPSKKHIIFWDKEKSEQRWVRPYQLTDNQFLKLSYNEQEEIVETEMERCKNGVWFYNHGEPIFLTGDNYHFLTYHKIDGTIISDFIKFQTYSFYFQKYCEDDENCFGEIQLKPRREGCTSRKMASAINRATTNETFFVGIQSKTGKDASEINFQAVIRSFNKLPFWRKPKTRLENPSRELAFEQPPKRSSGKIKTINELDYEDFYLNSKIDWRSTSADAYDGDKLHMYIEDEYFKWVEANAYKAWLVCRKCLVDGEDIIGKGYLLSTVGIEEEEGKVTEEALMNGVELWRGSNPNERNSIGQTETGLYWWFIGAHNSRRSKRFGWPDKYGNIPEEEVKKYLFTKRESEIDTQKRMVIIRQEPMNVQEALSSMLTGIGTFDNIRLGERLTFLENYQGTPERPVKYIECNLAWANNERFTEVVRVQSEKPRWQIPYLPNFVGDEFVNRVKKTSTNSYIPYSDTPFIIGVDPFTYDKTIDGLGSKGAFHVKHKYLNRYCCHYRFRPASTDLFFEDCLLTAWYYGARMNPERSGSNIFKFFKEIGCYGFIMNRPEVTKNSAFTKSDTEKGTTASPENVELGCNLIENYFSKPNEELNENVKDNLEYFWHEETIKQLMAFDKKKREKYDCVMAMIHTEIGAQSLKRFIMQPLEVNKDNKMSIVDILTPRFNNNTAILRNIQKFNR